MPSRLRLITTHDFFGSFAPIPTSYGSLTGGKGLRETVRSLADGAHSLWIDSGDFLQGGPLTLASKGNAGVSACGELGIDISVVGNHDLDFGADFLRTAAPKLGFPLLSANLDIGLPATRIVETPLGPIGIIGLTHHNLFSMRAWTVADEPSIPDVESYRPVDVDALASDLRRAGSIAVVLVVHDGVDWSFDDDGRYVFDERAFFERCPWAETVDVIVAGHTLGRYFGFHGKTPVLQPWPLGAEVGVIDLEFSGGRVQQVGKPRGILTQAAGKWTGSGSDIIDEAESDVIGILPTPLEARSGCPSLLASFLASSARDATGTDASFLYTTCGQPTLDGVFAYLAPAPVTRLQLLQMVPYTDFRLMTAEVDATEFDRIRALVRPRPQSRTTAWAEGGISNGNTTSVRITTLAQAGTRNIDTLIDRNGDWKDSGATLFDAIKERLARSSQ